MPKRESKGSPESLGARIKAAKTGLDPKSAPDGPVSQAHVAWRMVIDLVAGVGIGAAVGYGLDSLFGTQPWLMAVFVLLGFGAGVNLMLRTAKEVGSGKSQESGSASRGTRASAEDRGDAAGGE